MGELQLSKSFSAGMVANAESRDSILRLARRVDAAGLDSLWVGDHVSFHIPVVESLSFLSFLAAATERIRLGTAVYLVPLRHPTLTAKTTATLDWLSGGRLTLGVGVGGEFPPEFEAVGVPLKERGSRLDEGIEIMRKLWSGKRAGHEGRHFRFGPISIAPAPVQPGGPRVLIGGRKAAALRRAGRLGDGYISHMCSVDHYARNLEDMRAHAREANRPDLEFETAAFLFTILDQSYEAALDRAAESLGTIYNMPFRDAAKKYCLLGKPEHCLEQLQRFARVGARHFIFSPLMDSFEFADALESELLPALPSISI